MKLYLPKFLSLPLPHQKIDTVAATANKPVT